MPHEEKPDQVSESEPEEESEEEPVGDAKGANSNTDSRETVSYSIAYGEDTSSEERLGNLPIGLGHKMWAPTEPTIPPNIERSDPQPDPGAQQSEDTSEDSDAIIEALDDRLVQLQDVVDLNDSALGRRHGRVTVGETRLVAVEQEVIAAGQQDERAGERLDSFAALTIVNMMLLAFVLLRGWFT
ncbi:hypothetical protein L1987_43615 [Smallanthus sonchifolius]|uniref:Uncharacterized protein n=1 Tax=Smallanthus sonchifolius TaxID=185202 RepID=A0ACB9GN44_9ASTR|nr:hypothetical protein L1987_43615 [Smallanthus sonchifolius]